MTCAILQPSYVPWRGFFHQIRRADVFVWYDDVQYDKHGWRNRNRIKTPRGTRWLTIPVHSKGNVRHSVPINAIAVAWDTAWAARHWEILLDSYHRAPHFARYEPLLRSFYSRRPELLADFTIPLAEALAHELGVEDTRFIRSSSLGVGGARTDRLIAILRTLGADHYLSGPSAEGYIEADKFRAAGIGLEFMAYDYPAYEQLYPPYDPQVSILDLLFMTGPDAPGYIWRR